MKYTVYQITNIVNNKIYIGAHQTTNIDDGYMGSGKILAVAKNKYGISNFRKEILFVFDNLNEMYDKEAELVDQKFINRQDTYNAALGGRGSPYKSYSHLPNHSQMISVKTKAAMTPEVCLKISKAKLGVSLSRDHKKAISKTISSKYFGSPMDRTGSKISEAHKRAISIARKGKYKPKPLVLHDLEFGNHHEAASYFSVTAVTIGNWIKSGKGYYK